MRPGEQIGPSVVDCKALLATLQTPALIVDRGGCIVGTNQAAQRLCVAGGLHEGRQIEDLLPALADYWPQRAEGFDTGAPIDGPGSVCRVRVQGAPLCNRDGAPAGWLVILERPQQDVDGSSRLHSLLASLDDLVFVLDLQGYITEFHQASGGQQFVPEELLGRTYQELLPPSFAQGFATVMEEVRATGKVHRFDHPLHLGGKEHWFLVNVGPVWGEGEQLSGFVAVARNITEGKQAQAAAHEQRALAEALQDVALALNSTLNLEEIWKRILGNVERVVPADWAAILLIEDGVARRVGERNYTPQKLGAVLNEGGVQIVEADYLQKMIATGRTCLIPDTWNHASWPRSDQERFDDWVSSAEGQVIRSYLGAPIVLEGAVIGFINLVSSIPDHFNATHAERLQVFTVHAASAIRNAQLHAQAQELAAVNERQRLARELHDAVSQMLFSAKIIAEMLPRLRERDPDRVWRYLPELHRLIQGAMGEMRTLLLELRPGSLTDADLDVLLGYLVDAAGGRTSAKISLHCEGRCMLPDDVQVAFYRIAQEALSNAVKHARATTITLALHSCEDRVELLVEDDGCGFELDKVRPQNLGLGIMRERADEIGGTLTIRTVPQGGTSVRAVWLPSTGRF